MLISPALAHGLVHVETAGGGTALLIILAGVIAFFVIYRGWKKSRERKLRHDDGGGE